MQLTLADLLDKNDHWTHERCSAGGWRGQSYAWATAKLDGHCVTFFKQADGELVAYGRSIRRDLELTESYPFIKTMREYQILKNNMPPCSSVAGEIWVPGKQASDVKTALIACDPTTRFTAFAVPRWNGVDHSGDSVDFINVVKNLGIEIAQMIPAAEFGDDASLPIADRRAAMLEKSKKLGYEGWVLKGRNYAEWFKVKDEDTADCVCMSEHRPGRNKYEGWIGALRVGMYDASGELREVAAISGMDDATRRLMTNLMHEGKLAGRVVSVRFQCKTRHNKLRHPRFAGWRDDKPAEQCLLSSLDDVTANIHGD